MKKTSLIITAILCTILTLQSFGQDDMKKGVKVGLNSATLFGDDIENNDPVIDWHAGAFFRLNPEGTFSLQVELLYSRQGTEVAGDRLNLNYLTLPLMARLNFIEGKLGLYAGPQVGYLMSAKAEEEPEGYDTRDLYKDLDLSAIIGAEVDLFAGLVAGARYNFSLAYIGSGDDISIGDGLATVTVAAPEELGNAVLQIYAGFSF